MSPDHIMLDPLQSNNAAGSDHPEVDLAQLIDPPALQSLLADFHALTHIPVSIVDLHGRVLVGLGWQEVCLRFHRLYPQTGQYCTESDTELSAGVAPGEFRLYKCKNNMWDIATPILVVGRHAGNIFSGQFFFADEEPDRELFRAQARQYGWDEAAYLAALDRVPRLTRDQVNIGMTFLVKLADIVSRLGYSNLQLARSLSERDELARSLQASEERFRLAAHGANVGVWNWQPQTGEVQVGGNWHQVFGLEPAIPVTLDVWRNCIHPDDREATLNALLAARDTHADYQVEYRIVWPDGAVHWVADRGRGTFDEKGAALAFGGVNVDITHRKQAEEHVHAQRQLLEVIVQNLPAGVAVSRGVDHRIELVNAAYRAIAPGKEPLSKCYRDLWPEVYDQIGPIFQHVYESGQAYQAEDAKFLIQRSPDAPLEIAYFTWTLVRIRLPGDAEWGILNTAIETTERKRVEERVRELNRELEERAHDLGTAMEQVRATNAEVERANLRLKELLRSERASLVALEAANRELESFTYTVAHDLRAPLNLIEQMTEMLRTDYGADLEEAGRHVLDLIRENALTVNELAEDLLTLSRLSQQSLQKKPVSMDDLVRQVLAAFEPARAGRGVVITVHDLPDAEADPVLVKQVWVNLLSNALKFTRHRELAEITVASQDGTVYYVRDNGAGFQMEDADRLFRLFQRLHHAEDYPGNGLGLAIVERIIRRHGGRVWAEARPGQGATFAFTLG